MNKRRWWIFILLALTVVGLRLLLNSWQPERGTREERLSVRLDYAFDDVVYTELNANGKPFIRLTTPHLTHDPSRALTLAEQPRLLVQQPDRDWHISAAQGQWDRHSEALLFRGSVMIASARAQPPLQLETDQLRYYAQNRDVVADGAVRIQRDRAVATGTGLNGNLLSGEYRLLHDVEITINAPGDS